MPSHAELSGEPALRADARELARTVVAPSPDVVHAPGKNLLHCATIELAWRQLQRAVGDPVRFTEPVPLAEALDRAARAFGPEDLDAASYVARAGLGEDALASIRKELAQKFGDDASPAMLPASLAPDRLLVYAYLFKNLVFEEPFGREDTWGLAFGPKREQVRHFGVWPTEADPLHKKRAKQVTVHDHRTDADFVIELATKSRDDRLIVACVQEEATLAETAAKVMGRAKSSFLGGLVGGSLRAQDELRIPLIDFDILRELEELVGKRLAGREAVVDEAAQSIRFRLDDRGALLKSEVVIGVKRGGISPGFPPRRFVCDSPFLVLLARRGRKLPYFSLWIDNTELLRTAEPLPAAAMDPRLARPRSSS